MEAIREEGSLGGTHSTDLWNDFENYWLSVTKEQRKLKYDLLY